MEPITTADLPEVIDRYLRAHRAHDAATAIQAFAPDAVVVDDGKTYAGLPAIEGWLTRSSNEYTYTIAVAAMHRLDPLHYVVTNHLEGNFPGGQADLGYTFELARGVIRSLTIE